MTKPILALSRDKFGAVVIGDVCSPLPDVSAILQINGTDGGVLLPQLTTAQQNAITNPATGLLVFNTDLNAYTYYNGTEWAEIGSGAPGPAPTGGAPEAGVFILGATPTGSGIVGQETYKPNTVPANTDLATAITDTSPIIINVGANGGYENYSPTVTVNGVVATLTETSTKRWFTGTAQIYLTAGANTITATSDAGGTDSCIITLAAGGPAVDSVTFGSLPGTQTEVKHGDVVPVTITTDLSAVSVTVLASGACGTQVTFPVSGGVATGSLTIGTNSGAQPITVKAQNSLGTFGTNYTSTATLPLDQVIPSFSGLTVTYPSAEYAFDTGQAGTVTCNVSNFDTISYSSPNFSIGGAGASTYESIKPITNTSGAYVNSGTNYTITATKHSNGATASASTLVKVASVAPTAAITLTPASPLMSSPAGILYTLTIVPSQALYGAPSVNASLGMLQGSWTQTGNNWSIGLLISDSTARGTGDFTSLEIEGLSGISGSTITSGATYVVAGFSSRTITYPAFSRVAPLGTTIANPSNLSAQITGGNTLTLEPDNGVYSNGFYPANSDGSYNANGSYIGLSDTAFVGSNTSGTLQVTVQEAA